MRKRNHIIPLHLNKKELAHLEAQVKTSGLPREEFLRTLIMGAELRAKPCEHHADLLHKVAGLCNNASNRQDQNGCRSGQRFRQKTMRPAS